LDSDERVDLDESRRDRVRHWLAADRAHWSFDFFDIRIFIGIGGRTGVIICICICICIGIGSSVFLSVGVGRRPDISVRVGASVRGGVALGRRAR